MAERTFDYDVLRDLVRENPAASRAGHRGHRAHEGGAGLAGLGVRPAVGDLLGPGEEQVVELVQRLDALVGGLGQERLPDIAVEPFLLPRPSGE